jgi:hypothetical protein
LDSRIKNRIKDGLRIGGISRPGIGDQGLSEKNKKNKK